MGDNCTNNEIPVEVDPSDLKIIVKVNCDPYKIVNRSIVDNSKETDVDSGVVVKKRKQRRSKYNSESFSKDNDKFVRNNVSKNQESEIEKIENVKIKENQNETQEQKVLKKLKNKEPKKLDIGEIDLNFKTNKNDVNEINPVNDDVNPDIEKEKNIKYKNDVKKSSDEITTDTFSPKQIYKPIVCKRFAAGHEDQSVENGANINNDLPKTKKLRFDEYIPLVKDDSRRLLIKSIVESSGENEKELCSTIEEKKNEVNEIKNVVEAKLNEILTLIKLQKIKEEIIEQLIIKERVFNAKKADNNDWSLPETIKTSLVQSGPISSRENIVSIYNTNIPISPSHSMQSNGCISSNKKNSNNRVRRLILPKLTATKNKKKKCKSPAFDIVHTSKNSKTIIPKKGHHKLSANKLSVSTSSNVHTFPEVILNPVSQQQQQLQPLPPQQQLQLLLLQHHQPLQQQKHLQLELEQQQYIKLELEQQQQLQYQQLQYQQLQHQQLQHQQLQSISVLSHGISNTHGTPNNAMFNHNSFKDASNIQNVISNPISQPLQQEQQQPTSLLHATHEEPNNANNANTPNFKIVWIPVLQLQTQVQNQPQQTSSLLHVPNTQGVPINANFSNIPTFNIVRFSVTQPQIQMQNQPQQTSCLLHDVGTQYLPEPNAPANYSPTLSDSLTAPELSKTSLTTNCQASTITTTVSSNMQSLNDVTINTQDEHITSFFQQNSTSNLLLNTVKIESSDMFLIEEDSSERLNIDDYSSDRLIIDEDASSPTINP